MPLIDYKLAVLKRDYDLTKTEDKRRYVSEAIKIVRTADSEAEREELLKQLRDASGISFEALKRDLDATPRENVSVKDKPPVIKHDDADVSKKASRYVIAQFLFDADCAKNTDINSIEFHDGVHALIAKYISSVKMMDEPVHLSELFEFFDAGTPEYAELDKILDYSEGGGLTGEIGEKYFSDCVKKLKLDAVDRRIAEEKAKIATITDIGEQAAAAQKINALTKQREKIKKGD